MREYELYTPVKNLFSEMGYKVNAEVKDCDMTAFKENELIIVELKKNLSVALLAQALERQKTGAEVYIAVPKPKKYSPKKFRDTLYVIKKLELGLIFVNLLDDQSYAEIVLEPQEFKPVGKRYKERKSIIKEINGRSIDNNTGGVNRRKIATAFTEKCIHIGVILETMGALKPKSVRENGGDDGAAGIMYRNAYGWFKRNGDGTYDITDKFCGDMINYPELYEYYKTGTGAAKEEM